MVKFIFFFHAILQTDSDMPMRKILLECQVEVSDSHFHKNFEFELIRLHFEEAAILKSNLQIK